MEARLDTCKGPDPPLAEKNPSVLARVEDIVGSSPEVSSLPQVVAKILDLSSDATSSAADIEKVISVDPGFCARLLRVANSAYFGLPRKVTSIKEAVVLLGVRSIRNLALTVSCYNVFIGRTDADSLLRRELWRHSVLCALCSRSLASFGSTCPREEGFVAGLLHDIGKCVALSAVREEALAAIERQRAEGIPSFTAERAEMGFDHTEIGARLAEKWGLPAILVSAIEHHHSVELLPPSPERDLAASVALADSIVSMLESQAQYGPDGIPEDLPAESLDLEAASALGIHEENLSKIVMMLVNEVANASTLQSFAA
jgi:putative nucleotidyltransferase with HDIG domain